MAPTLADLRLPVKIDPALLAAAARVVFYTLLWYTFSIGITFYNKWLFQWCVVTSVRPACALGWSRLVPCSARPHTDAIMDWCQQAATLQYCMRTLARPGPCQDGVLALKGANHHLSANLGQSFVVALAWSSVHRTPALSDGMHGTRNLGLF